MKRKPTKGGRKPPSSTGKVGYRRPPEHAQFKPGQSGNPAGRPRGSRNYKTRILDTLFAELEVTIDGETQYMPKLLIIIEKLMSIASKGHFNSAAFLVNLYLKIANDVHASGSDQIELAPEDRAILNRYAARLIMNKANCGGANG